MEIPLRPITLLFGANSAGKSTILQALLYLRELLEHQNADADFLSASGAAIHLGGFRQMVHGHDLSREIRIGVRMDLDDDGLPSYLDADFLPDPEPTDEEEDEEDYCTLYEELTSVRLKLTVRWDAQRGAAEICGYKLSDGSGEVAEIVPDAVS